MIPQTSLNSLESADRSRYDASSTSSPQQWYIHTEGTIMPHRRRLDSSVRNKMEAVQLTTTVDIDPIDIARLAKSGVGLRIEASAMTRPEIRAVAFDAGVGRSTVPTLGLRLFDGS